MRGSVLALAFALAATGLGIAFALKQRDNAELTAQVTRLTRQNADLRYEVKQASQQATDVGQRAVELDSQLGTTKARTTATEARSVQLTRELTETKSRLTEREQREAALMAELADLRRKVAAGSRSEEPVVLPTVILATNRTPATPAAVPPAVDVGPYRERIAQLEAQLTQLLTRALEEPVAAAEPAPAPVPATVQYQVVRVGAASTFVVVDYGAEQGARPQAIIRLARGTSELAQVQISDVRPRFSLAQVVPGTLKGQLQTGDLVVFNP